MQTYIIVNALHAISVWRPALVNAFVLCSFDANCSHAAVSTSPLASLLAVVGISQPAAAATTSHPAT
jgi:hypothetical protein